MKGNSLIIEYIEKIKELVAQLAVIEEFVPKNELILYIFNGLDTNYNPYICSINNLYDDVSIEHVHSQLLPFEGTR